MTILSQQYQTTKKYLLRTVLVKDQWLQGPET